MRRLVRLTVLSFVSPSLITPCNCGDYLYGIDLSSGHIYANVLGDIPNNWIKLCVWGQVGTKKYMDFVWGQWANSESIRLECGDLLWRKTTLRSISDNRNRSVQGKKDDGGLNLLTALAGSFQNEHCAHCKWQKVINGAIRGGKSGHTIFSSLSGFVMTFRKMESSLQFLITAFFFIIMRGGGVDRCLVNRQITS